MDYEPGQGYQMDHYTVYPQDGMASVTEFGPQFDPDEQYLAISLRARRPQLPAGHRATQPNVMTALNGTDHGWVYNNLEPGATQPWHSIFDELSAHATLEDLLRAAPSILNGTIWDQIIPPGHRRT